MGLATQEGLIQKQWDIKMIDKLFIISLYAIPTIGLLLVCFWIAKKK
jgi:hypothetical protein